MDEWRPHSRGLRRFFSFAILLLGSVGVFLFVLSEQTDRLFAWTIDPPLTAAFLGANYWGAIPLALLSAREPVWARARISYVVTFVFTSLTLLATFLHLDKFEFGNANGWLWVVVYVSVPLAMVALIPLQRRLPGGDPPREAPLERWVVPVVALQALVASGIGVALIVAPSTAAELWPWQLTPLTARAVGAWLLALTAGLVVTLWENDWTRIRVAAPTYAAMASLQFVALARYSDTLDWGGVDAWLYVVYLASVLALGAYGIRRSWAASRSEASLQPGVRAQPGPP